MQDSKSLEFEKLENPLGVHEEDEQTSPAGPWKKRRPLCVSLRSSAPALLLSWAPAHCHNHKAAPRGGESNLGFQVAAVSHHWK